jgi:Ca-activated chloride channel family protein
VLLSRLGFCLLLLGLGIPGWAQARFSARADLVVLSATAVDGKGRPVRDLRAEEFRVYDEGRPQPLRHFVQGPELAARLLLLVDASGSMNSELKLTSSRMAAYQLLDALPPEDQVALAGFDHKYWGIVAFTRERAKVKAAFDELAPFGSTALHDALDKAASDIASHGEGRRAVVVITDGVDTASQKAPDDVIARSRALDVPIYAISVVSPLDDPNSDRFAGQERPAAATAGGALLARYSQQSGGAAFLVSDFRALRQAATQIVAELKHQYRLGYEPPDSPKHFRRIEVRSTRKGVVVRTRSGFVPPS